MIEHPDRMKDSIIAKLANQAADYYGEAFKQCHCKDSVPKVRTHTNAHTQVEALGGAFPSVLWWFPTLLGSEVCFSSRSLSDVGSANGNAQLLTNTWLNNYLFVHQENRRVQRLQ